MATTLLNKEIIEKSELRKLILKKRKETDEACLIEKASSKIVSSIFLSNDFIEAKNIALYYPIKNEIDLRRLLNVKGKNFYLPRCNKNKLEFAKYTNENDLKSGEFGILEPQGKAINPNILDVIYIPALCANSKNYRLGYGKGFYDRFFAKNKNLKAKKIIVVKKEFILDSFLEDEFDIQCDYTIS